MRKTVPPAQRHIGLLAFAGLADLAVRELGDAAAGPPAVLRLRNYDWITIPVNPERFDRLPLLRTVEDVFLLLGNPLPLTGRAALAGIDSLVTSPAVLKAVEWKNRLFRPAKPGGRPSFNCFVKQDRDRPIYRREIAARVNARMAKIFPRWRQADPAAIEIWAVYVDNALQVAFRLSDHRMRYRGKEPALREAALRPTVAAAMALLSDPRPGEHLVDPMCGAGVILSEAVARQPDAVLLGGDSDPDAARMAAERLTRHKVPVQTWDAAALPLPARSVDCIVCNLPFGKKYSTRSDNRTLYPTLLSHWLTVLKPGGRMILLTADSPALESTLDALRLPWRIETKVKVLGLWASVYRISSPTPS